jgi:hypothetical protein
MSPPKKVPVRKNGHKELTKVIIYRVRALVQGFFGRFEQKRRIARIHFLLSHLGIDSLCALDSGDLSEPEALRQLRKMAVRVFLLSLF